MRRRNAVALLPLAAVAAAMPGAAQSEPTPRNSVVARCA